MSYRSDWVTAKSQATKLNGGKDVWKDNKLKDEGFGPAIVAFELAVSMLEAFDTKYDKFSLSEKQKGQRSKLVQAQTAGADKVHHIGRNYEIELKRLESTGYITAAVLKKLDLPLVLTERYIKPFRLAK